MQNGFRISSALLAEVDTHTRELMANTPYQELQRALLVSSKVTQRLAVEMDAGGIPMDKYLLLEKRLARQLRETRAIAREMRLIHRRCQIQAREYVISRSKDDLDRPEKPSEPAPKESEIDMKAQVKLATKCIENSLPQDPKKLDELMEFTERTANEIARQFSDKNAVDVLES
ncbi:hypothetical protein OAU50_02585 [Planctomycetota bacterium]|nr:hypothetical protein [Planctomycetota bacterium]